MERKASNDDISSPADRYSFERSSRVLAVQIHNIGILPNRLIMPSSSSSSEGEEVGFRGKPDDDWLNNALGHAGGRPPGSRRQAKLEDKRKQEELNQRLLASRQWKPKETSATNSNVNDGSTVSARSESSSSRSTIHSTTSNDFGVSWLQRALDRVYEQAKDQKLPLEEIAKERWGSLDKLKQMLTEAKEKFRADQDSLHEPSTSRNRHHKSVEKYETRGQQERRDEIGDRIRRDDRREYYNRDCTEKRLQSGNSRHHEQGEKESGQQFQPDQAKKSEDPKVYTVQLPSSSNSEEQPGTEHEYKPLTEAEKNSIHAKIIKAEMLGNAKMVQELKTKLEKAKKASAPREETKVIKVYKKLNEDEMSIKELFMREKTLDTEKDGKMFAKSSLKSINPHKFNPDDEYDIEPKKKKRCQDDGLEREEEKNEVECINCYSKYSKKLILAFGSHTFLCFSQNEPLVDGHVCIRSMNHVPSNLVSADEEVHEEVDKLKLALVQMFSGESKSVIFTESYRKCTKKYDNHMIIDCIPVPTDQMTEARLYFKKAILESETEWAINKKLVEFKGRHVARMLPNKLPHFWVTFGSGNEGYGHVIEDEQNFPWNFAYEIIGGLLDIEAWKWRKPKRASYDKLNELASKIRKSWVAHNPFRGAKS